MRWIWLALIVVVGVGCASEPTKQASTEQPAVADPRHEDAQNAPHLAMEAVMTAIERAGIKKAAVNTKDHFIVITGIAESEAVKVAAAAAAKAHLAEGQELLDEVEVVRG
ncbi:MAG TPA: hypothetical protein PKA27_12325 [Fimbriimonadaceae bacterium]|nr:hypothetical protein [Fimbriimonadaceae bacterium]